MTSEPDITGLLRQYHAGNRGALDRVMPLVYAELRRIADGQMRHQGHDHTLQPTALIHEAYLKLASAHSEYRDRTHFFAVAAAVMRNILVDYARARNSEKRGGRSRQVPIEEDHPAFSRPAELLALDDALNSLARVDQRKARILELRYFAGLNVEETAEAINVSVATVGRETRFAEVWLRRELLAARAR